MTGTTVFWWAPIFPLAAFALLSVGLARLGRVSAWLSLVAMAGSTIVSGLGLYAAYHGQQLIVAIPWWSIGGRSFEIALWLDPLSSLSAALVSVVGLVIFGYSVRYMAGEPLRGRFFAEMNLFAGAMLVLVLTSDLLVLFFAWEIVGLASYLLIGFWFDRPGTPPAATKAFLVTRLGDLAMLIGVLLLVKAVGGGSIPAALAAAGAGRLPYLLALAAALLLFVAAAAKSAQFPFQGWLPDAMLGPTPVSALIHSATMVAAGVFLVARFFPLFQAAPPALAVVAWVGVATALLGAAVALVSPDAKRTLAYSTMSELGLMYVGLGAGSLLAGMLLLIAHALFKSLLFLAVGAVDQQVHGTEFRLMGGLWLRMPLVFVASVFGAAALAGLPVTAALPSKDPVLAAAWQANLGLYALALLASLLTALYAARILGLVFLGAPSAESRRAHGAPLGLWLPTVAMAALLVAGSLAGAIVLGRPLSQLLGAPTPEVVASTALALTIAVAGSALGLWARWVWPREVLWPPLRSFAGTFGSEFGMIPLYDLSSRAGLVTVRAAATVDAVVFDPLGDRLALGALHVIAAARAIDASVFDRLGNWLAEAVLWLIRWANRFDLGGLDAAVRRLASSTLRFSQLARRLETGRIENYLLAVLVWGIVVALAAVVGSALGWR
ncbi:MAG: NADH-quinone oxidoreductase subunit 5 family protein [Chloroflexota bacterium]